MSHDNSIAFQEHMGNQLLQASTTTDHISHAESTQPDLHVNWHACAFTRFQTESHLPRQNMTERGCCWLMNPSSSPVCIDQLLTPLAMYTFDQSAHVTCCATVSQPVWLSWKPNCWATLMAKWHHSLQKQCHWQHAFWCWKQQFACVWTRLRGTGSRLLAPELNTLALTSVHYVSQPEAPAGMAGFRAWKMQASELKKCLKLR